MKRRILTVFVTCFLVLFSMGSNLYADTTNLLDSVVVLDPNLEEYLRSSVFYNIAEEDPITESMMLEVAYVSTSYQVYDDDWNQEEKQITDFTGMEHAKNLVSLRIEVNLSNIQNYTNVEALNDLDKLQEIYLDYYDYSYILVPTKDEIASLKVTFRDFIDHLENGNVKDLSIGYNIREHDVDYSWLEGIDLYQKVASVTGLFQEMPVKEKVKFREIGTNEQNEKLYKMTYHNPINAIYIDDDGILKADPNYNFLQTYVMNYGGQKIDDSLIKFYDKDGNLLEPEPGYYGTRRFSYVEATITESQLEAIGNDSRLFTLSIKQISGDGTLPSVNLHNLITLHLDTSPDLYSLAYSGNGHTDGIEPEDTNEYEDGDSATLLDEGTLEKDGHTFAGWNTNALGTGDTYQPGDGFVISEDTTLYAIWEADVTLYSLAYNGNENTDGTEPEDINEYEDGDSATLLDEGTLEKSGHTFAGWNTNALGTGDTYQPGDEFVISEDTTLYAMWAPIATTTYNITYDGNGHTGGIVPVDTNAYDIGDSVTVLSGSELKKDGYVFSGWNTKPNGNGVDYTENATFSISASSPMTRAVVSYVTLYAQWTKKNAPLIPVTPEETSKPSIEVPTNKGNNVSTVDTTNITTLLILGIVSAVVLSAIYSNKKTNI